MPVMSATASFQRYLAGFKLGEKLEHPLAFKRLAQHHSPAPVDSVQFENLLCDIEADSCNLHLGPSRSSYFDGPDYHRWLYYEAVYNAGWVHPINESRRCCPPLKRAKTNLAAPLIILRVSCDRLRPL